MPFFEGAGLDPASVSAIGIPLGQTGSKPGVGHMQKMLNPREGLTSKRPLDLRASARLRRLNICKMS